MDDFYKLTFRTSDQFGRYTAQVDHAMVDDSHYLQATICHGKRRIVIFTTARKGKVYVENQHWDGLRTKHFPLETAEQAWWRFYTMLPGSIAEKIHAHLAQVSPS